jgi:hypothetical protein
MEDADMNIPELKEFFDAGEVKALSKDRIKIGCAEFDREAVKRYLFPLGWRCSHSWSTCLAGPRSTESGLVVEYENKSYWVTKADIKRLIALMDDYKAPTRQAFYRPGDLVEIAGEKVRLLYFIGFSGANESWCAGPLKYVWLVEPHTHPIVERDGRRPTWTPGTILGRSAGGFGAKLRLLRFKGFRLDGEIWDCQDHTNNEMLTTNFLLLPENWRVVPSPNEQPKPSPKPPSDLLEQIRRLRSDFDSAVDKILKEAE